LATKRGVEGKPVTIRTPLLTLTKADIIQTGISLNVDYALTVSCYKATNKGEACGSCDSCEYMRQGFVKAGISDPTLY